MPPPPVRQVHSAFCKNRTRNLYFAEIRPETNIGQNSLLNPRASLGNQCQIQLFGKFAELCLFRPPPPECPGDTPSGSRPPAGLGVLFFKFFLVQFKKQIRNLKNKTVLFFKFFKFNLKNLKNLKKQASRKPAGRPESPCF